jgi:UDP-N-acetylglucosamine 2-epimerase (non-hydrolysing)
LEAIKKYDMKNIIVHSGQHYDIEMSKIFFDELSIPDPNYNLEVGSASHGIQTGKMLIALDEILLSEKPDIVLVYGDTNTTLAGALASYKLHIPVAHIEAGMREYIWRPEEMNKKVADHCSDYCFCPIERACKNLSNEGISSEKIFFTGDITYDAFLKNKSIALEKGNIKIPNYNYILMTMHRAETVDDENRIANIIDAIIKIPEHIIFPIHPRTRKRLLEFGLFEKLEKSDNIQILNPIGYFEFLKLLINADLIITDSSGVIKETFYAKKMGVTIDNTTEYKEIFDIGYNILAGFKKDFIKKSIISMLSKDFIEPSVYPFGDGHSANRMVEILYQFLGK